MNAFISESHGIMTAPVLINPAKLYLSALFSINIYIAQTAMLFKNLQFLKVNFFIYTGVCHIYPPCRRKRIVSLFFGRDVRTRLGVAISEVFGAPVFHIKIGALSALPKDTTSKLVDLFSTTFRKCQAPSREAVDTVF